MIGPQLKINKAIELLNKEIELQNNLIATDQKKLNEYSKKYPEKILFINDRQKLLNDRAQSIEDIATIISFIPLLVNELKSNTFYKGLKAGETENKKTIPDNYFFNDTEKEALRARSIYEAQIKYNY